MAVMTFPVPSESNWLLLISYDGTNYNGWQVQPTNITIEGTLENALLRLTGLSKFTVERTDARVHGLNQTASFRVVSEFSPEKWRIALRGSA